MSTTHPLRAYRKKHGLSMVALAAVAGTTRQTIFRVENGQQEPSVSLMRRLAKATDNKVTEDEILRACLTAGAAA